ncbi:MAG: hypothetical protein JXR07_08040 [Reichenbachiella sp.]
MSFCSTGKKSHDTLELAEESLIENHIRFNHPFGSGPINVYQCSECGYFHFTSQGEINPILVEKAEFIKRQQLARKWENKLGW